MPTLSRSMLLDRLLVYLVQNQTASAYLRSVGPPLTEVRRYPMPWACQDRDLGPKRRVSANLAVAIQLSCLGGTTVRRSSFSTSVKSITMLSSVRSTAGRHGLFSSKLRPYTTTTARPINRNPRGKVIARLGLVGGVTCTIVSIICPALSRSCLSLAIRLPFTFDPTLRLSNQRPR